ncbi:D-amino acid dehydrogenase small subunit [Pseudonocardia hierapolitana]|uniref:D-amino acid dehydrogenase small subunit n=1 Tax=Pseudonocardia hierapolitana TaxID=1128676 RepID=A0A561T1V8_9PSEU|nr:FAD-dependent oxidoreductase [Pseudonocardia hierapolitana]TWF81075.1 D-amino acid dehydrogenase small subunit [Pseudonocardia hierapolitana]
MHVPPHPPRRVVVAGAGMVGLATAWFLQEHGAEVTVLDRSDVGAGASWGNAGYLTPVMAVPLPEPGLLREGLRGLLDPASPLHVTPRPTPATLAFLLRFAARSTSGTWRAGLAALTPLDRGALAAFDELAAGGVAAPTHEAPVLIGFPDPGDDAGLRHELAAVRAAGQDVRLTAMADVGPPFSERIRSVLRLDGQRHVDPGRFLSALADSVRSRGGRIVAGARVRAVRFGPAGLQVDTWTDRPEPADAVVLATGAWLPELARTVGVRLPVQAGRGYSFSAAADRPLPQPVYLPAARVALTPLGERVRVAGTMEIADRDAPFDGRRVAAIVRSVAPYLRGVDLADVRDPWVGPRPLTPDGLPLIGPTRMPGVHVAGGHGMWGVTLGPVTGKLLARTVMTSHPVPELGPFDPLRFGSPGRRPG